MPAIGHALGLPFNKRKGQRVPFPSSLYQRNKGGIADDTTNEVNDLLEELYVTRANYVNSNCGYFNGNVLVEIPVVNDFPDDFIISGWIDFTPSTHTREGFASKYDPTTGNRSFRFEKTADDVVIYTCPDGLFSTMVSASVPLSSIASGVQYFEFRKVGTEAYISVAGAAEIQFTGDVSETIHQSDESIILGNVAGAWPYYSQMYGIKICMTNGVCVMNLPISAGYGIYVNDGSGYENNGTITGVGIVDFWSTTQDNYHRHLEDGFSIYDDGVNDSFLVSFMSSGIPNPSPLLPSGYTLTNHVEGCSTSGAVHNGAETEIQGTDSNVLYSRFFSDDETTLEERDWAFAQAFLSGEQDWLRWGLDKYGSCMLEELNLYIESFEPDATEETRLETYHKQGDCGGGFTA